MDLVRQVLSSLQGRGSVTAGCGRGCCCTGSVCPVVGVVGRRFGSVSSRGSLQAVGTWEGIGSERFRLST